MLKIDPADVGALGGMLTFLEGLPAADLPAVADLAVVEDGTAVTGEVMNLLTRRNLLFKVVPAASASYQINIAMGSPGYPAAEAADPSAFALKIRRQLTDEKRTLRVYGSEVVIARLTGDGTQIRLHLLNYGGREIEGLRIRVRGAYANGDAQIAGAGRVPLADHAVADGFTEFSVPRLATYAVVDLKRDGAQGSSEARRRPALPAHSRGHASSDSWMISRVSDFASPSLYDVRDGITGVQDLLSRAISDAPRPSNTESSSSRSRTARVPCAVTRLRNSSRTSGIRCVPIRSSVASACCASAPPRRRSRRYASRVSRPLLAVAPLPEPRGGEGEQRQRSALCCTSATISSTSASSSKR